MEIQEFRDRLEALIEEARMSERIPLKDLAKAVGNTTISLIRLINQGQEF
jgi:hypothetical protein